MHDGAGWEEEALIAIVFDKLMWNTACCDWAPPQDLLHNGTHGGQIGQIVKVRRAIISGNTIDLFVQLLLPERTVAHGETKGRHCRGRSPSTGFEECADYVRTLVV